MRESPETRDSLLIRISDPTDREAWEEFACVYRPVLYRLARIQSLQDADAQDLTQRVLIAVSEKIGDWQRQPGTLFRHWLFRVAKNAAINHLTRLPKDRGSGDSRLQQLPLQSREGNAFEQSYELEYQRQVYRVAADRVRARADATTWLAFSLTMIDGLSIEEAALQLEIGQGNVYASRSRIVRRLRNEVKKLLSEEDHGIERGAKQDGQ